VTTITDRNACKARIAEGELYIQTRIGKILDEGKPPSEKPNGKGAMPAFTMSTMERDDFRNVSIEGRTSCQEWFNYQQRLPSWNEEEEDESLPTKRELCGDKVDSESEQGELETGEITQEEPDTKPGARDIQPDYSEIDEWDSGPPMIREEEARELLDLLAKENFTLAKIRMACLEVHPADLDHAMMEAEHLKMTERTWYHIGSVVMEMLQAFAMPLPEIYVLTKAARLQSLQQKVRIHLGKIDEEDAAHIVSVPDRMVQMIKNGKGLADVSSTVTTMLKDAMDERQYDTIMEALVFMDGYLSNIHMNRDGTFVDDNKKEERAKDVDFTHIDDEDTPGLSMETKEYLIELTKDMFAARANAVALLETLENQADVFRNVIQAIKARNRGMLTDALAQAEANDLDGASHDVIGKAKRLLTRVIEEETLEEETEQVLSEHVGLSYEKYEAVIQKAFDMGFEPRSFDAVLVTRSVLRMQNWFRSHKALKHARTYRRAERQLRNAIEAQDLDLLKKTIVNGHKTYGQETKLLKHARFVYEYVSRREKVVRDVVRGHAVVKNTHAIGYGMDLLGEAVKTAHEHGITDIPKIQEASKLYKDLARGRAARDMLRKIQKGCVVSNIAEEDLAQMKEIIHAAIRDCKSSPFPIDQPMMDDITASQEIDDQIWLIRQLGFTRSRMKIEVDEKGRVKLSQKADLPDLDTAEGRPERETIVNRFNMAECKGVKATMNSANLPSKADLPDLDTAEGRSEWEELKKFPMRQAIGSLLHLAQRT